MTMSDLEEAIQLVNAHSQLVRVRYDSQPTARIAQAEAALGVQFPPTFRQYLRTFGKLTFAGTEFYGIPARREIEESYLIWATRKQVEDGFMPHGMVIVADDGMGSDFVMDLRKVIAGDEGPVVYWHPGESTPDNTLEIVAENFGKFFKQEVEAAIARRTR
jgi:hypothetical protein